MKHLKISCEINDNKRAEQNEKFHNLKHLKSSGRVRITDQKLLRFRSKGHRIWFAGTFSENHHILEKQDSPSNKNIVLKRRNSIVVY